MHDNAPRRELPRYQSHKQVWALKIASIRVPDRPEGAKDDGSRELHFEDAAYMPIALPHDWIARHAPKPGGYMVVYGDGYRSYSPAEPFEQGYTLISSPGLIMPAESAELATRFTYHPPHGDQADRYQTIRDIARGFAHHLELHCPNSRERSLALTKLEEAVMWANASIARREPHVDPVGPPGDPTNHSSVDAG